MLKQTSPRGRSVPWLWTRRQIARNWNCKPEEVDLAPWFEVYDEMVMMGIESEAQAFWARRRQSAQRR